MKTAHINPQHGRFVITGGGMHSAAFLRLADAVEAFKREWAPNGFRLAGIGLNG